MAYNGGGIWWYKGLVVVGFGVDGVTDVDELVGGGGRWCRGGVGREWMRCGDAMRCVEKKDEYPSSTYHLLINVIEIEPSCRSLLFQRHCLDLCVGPLDQAFGTDALLHINNRSMTTKTLGEEYSDITQVFGTYGLPPTPARRALFIVYQNVAPCIAERVRRETPLQMVCDMRRTRQQVLYDREAGDARYP
ncbi:hypothetical protein Tco_0960660 [Tanacetum coccineum]